LQHCLSRELSQAADDLRTNCRNLALEEGAAYQNFVGFRIAVVWGPAFQDVADVGVVATNADGFDDFRKKASRFANEAQANVEISWLAPRKVRQMVVVGSKRMVQYDDTASDEPIRVYDRGMDLEWDAPASFGEYQLTYRSGDVIIPRIDAHEPLALELADFARSIRTGSTPRSNAMLGLEIVSVLEAADASLRRNGAPIAVGPARDKVAA